MFFVYDWNKPNKLVVFFRNLRERSIFLCGVLAGVSIVGVMLSAIDWLFA